MRYATTESQTQIAAFRSRYESRDKFRIVEVKDDEFGLYMDMPDYDSFDAIEDIFIEHHEIVAIGVQFENELGEEVFRVWFDHSVGTRVIQNVVDQYF